MKPTKITIEFTDNGAVMEVRNHFDFNEGKPFKLVYEFDEDNKEKLRDMLYMIDHIAFFDEGKYARERCFIEIVHGESYECKDPTHCKICNPNGI